MGLKKNRKEIIKSIMAMSLSGVLLAGGTLAYFTKTVTSSGNVVTTDKLDVKFEMKTGDSWTTIDSKKEGHKLVFENDKIQIGQTITKTVKVSNIGDLPFEYSLDLFKTENTESKDIDETIDVVINNTDSTKTLQSALEGGETEYDNWLAPGESKEIDITFTMNNTKAFSSDLSGDVISTFDIQVIANQIEEKIPDVIIPAISENSITSFYLGTKETNKDNIFVQFKTNTEVDFDNGGKVVIEYLDSNDNVIYRKDSSSFLWNEYLNGANSTKYPSSSNRIMPVGTYSTTVKYSAGIFGVGKVDTPKMVKVRIIVSTNQGSWTATAKR